MARNASAVTRMRTRPAPSARSTNARSTNDVLDVTVVLLEAGYASTAIAPIEVFHSAGLLWNWLHGEPRSSHASGCAPRRSTAPRSPASARSG